MKNNPNLYTILILLLFSTNLFSQSKPFTEFRISSVEAVPGDTVCVDVIVTDFQNIQAVSLGIHWDTSAMKLETYDSPSPIPADGFNLPPTNPGFLFFDWNTAGTVTLEDGSTFIQLCFAVRASEAPKYAFVAFDDSLSPTTVLVNEEEFLNPNVDARFYPGGLSIRIPGNDLTISSEVEAYRACGDPVTGIKVDIQGGPASYLVEWTGPDGFLGEGPELLYIPDGFYQMKVVDQSGLLATGSFSINVIENDSGETEFISDAEITPSDCNQQEGRIALTVNGGPETYTFLWDNGDTTAIINDLGSGEYIVTVTDRDDCQQIQVFQVPGTGNIRYEIVHDTLTCQSASVQIGVEVENPELFSFVWETGEAEPLIDVNRGGPYRLYIQNGTDCVETVDFWVPIKLTSFEIEKLESDISCLDGTATIGVLNPDPELSYLWVSDGRQTPQISVTEAGEYFLRITNPDNEVCSFTTSFQAGPARMDAQWIEVRDTLFCGEASAFIGLDSIRGENLTFSWSNGAETPVLEVGTPGDYTITVSQGNFCTETIGFNVVEEDLRFALERINGEIGCSTSSTTIGVVSPEDTSGFSYFWPQSGETSPQITVDQPSPFLLEVRKGDCFAEYWLTVDFINYPAGLERIEAPWSCADTLLPIGVTAPDTSDYTYSWDSGEETPTIDIRQTGLHRLTITDGPDCQTDFIFYFPADRFIQYNYRRETLSCTNPEAQIGVQALSNEPYQYTWNTGDTTNLIEVTEPGNYALNIQLGNFCRKELAFPVSQADSRQLFTQIFEPIRCKNSTATIGVDYPDFIDPTFIWSTGDTTNTIDVMEPALYSLTVDAGPSCIEVFEFLAWEESTIAYQRVTEGLTCYNPSGRIGVEALGSRAYTFLWNTGATTPLLDVNENGSYELTITDVNSLCTEIVTFEVDSDSFELATPEITSECLGDGDCGGVVFRVKAEDARTPVVYSWSTGQVDTAGISSELMLRNRREVGLEITDAEGCSIQVDNILPNCPFESQLRLRMYLSCETDSQSMVQPVINAEVLSGGIPPYNFVWPGQPDFDYYRSSAPFDGNVGNYSITVNDQLSNVAVSDFLSSGNYGCGEENNSVLVEAPHVVAEPGSSFVYPIQVSDFENLSSILLKMSWDNCLLEADSIVLLHPERRVFSSGIQMAGGNYELYIGEIDTLGLADTSTIIEFYFAAMAEVEGVSPFLFTLSEPGQFRGGSPAFLRPLHGSITVAKQQALVRPGDTNTDLGTDHFDLLNLGLFYQESGPDRRIGWTDTLEYSYPWQQRTPVSNIDIKHLDCNGDGLINALDTVVIVQNWDLSLFNEEGSIEKSNGPDLFVQTDSLRLGTMQSFPIIMGEETLQVEDAYGIALTILYDDKMLAPESVFATFTESWLKDNTTSPPLFISRNDPKNFRLHLAIVRTDQTNINAYGELARLHFTSLDSEEISAASFQIENVRLINAEEKILPVNQLTTFAPIENTTSLNTISLENFIQLYPIPTSDWLRIDHPADWLLQRAEIFDLNGRLWHSKILDGHELNVSELPSGIFILRLVTDRGVIAKRWVKGS